MSNGISLKGVVAPNGTVHHVDHEYLDNNPPIPEADDTLSIPGKYADAAKVGAEFSGLREDLIHMYSPVFIPNGTGESTSADVTYTQQNDKITANGKANGTSFYNLYYNKVQMPSGIEAGKDYLVEFNGTNVYIELYYYVNLELNYLDYTYSPKIITIPNNAEGMLIRLRVANGKTATNETVSPIIRNINSYVEGQLSKLFSQSLYNYGTGASLYQTTDNILHNSIYFISVTGGTPSIEHWGLEFAGWLVTMPIGTAGNVGVFQMALPMFDEKPVFRARYNGTWGSWQSIAETSTTIQNTYNITTSPTITTDTNGWLQAVDTDTADETGKTDMTGAIMSMLTDTGYCHLGEGIFYVSGNIDMPNNSMIEGCGRKTIIRLLGSVTSGYCIKPSIGCTIKNLSISGSRSEIVLSSSIGNRNGIVISGNGQYVNKVSSCWFNGFDGSAIYQNGNGGSVMGYLTAIDCTILNCNVGINVDVRSEYCKYTDVVVYSCYYACINNGGNNVFNNCTFHGVVGFLLDNTLDNKGNNAHGSAVGCIFNHIDNLHHPDTLGGGLAIHMINASHGFVFTGCQLWYGNVLIEDSDGILIADSLFGNDDIQITVTGEKPLFLFGNLFKTTPTITSDDNIIMSNNYVTDGSAVTVN